MGSEPTNEQVLEALRLWAREAGLSQTELAELTGLGQSTVSRYLSGASSRLRASSARELAKRVPTRFLSRAVQASSPSSDRRRQGDRPVVFVSSTYLDNVRRRAWVREAIERAGMEPLAMERWSADERSARELCVHRVAEADVFVCILAWRYGWVPEGESKSITELEYDEAVRLGKPRLVFWIDQKLGEVDVESEFDADDRWGKQKLLDAFKERAKQEQTAAPFTDPDLKVLVLQALTEWARRSFPGWVRSEEAAQPKIDEYEELLADYLEAVQAEHSLVQLPGFSGKLRTPLGLDDLYVPIDLAQAHDPEEAAREGLRLGKRGPEDGEQERNPTLASALQLVAADRRLKGLFLLGHPGSGKTTQLRRLALSSAREGPETLGLSQELVPVFVPLRKLKPEDKTLAELTKRLLADDDGGFDAGFARWLWDRGKLLLLVDGLDEVPKDRRGEVKEWIETVSRRRKGDLLVVTCRHEGYTRDVRFGPELAGYSLRPLSNEQAERFVQRWYAEVETGLLPNSAGERARKTALREADASALDLNQRLADPSVRASRVNELAHNPLLLTAICLVHRDRAKLPDRAAELYAETVDVLLQHWREAKRLPVTFEARTARRILQPLALWLHEVEGRTQASEGELCEVLQQAMDAAGWKEMTPAAFLATVRDESGLLTGWSAERFGFLHLAFQEYLAAAELCRRALQQAGDVDRFHAEVYGIARRFHETWWREIISLVFAVDKDGALFRPLVHQLLLRADLVLHVDLFQQCLADAQVFDATPFRELLEQPSQFGLWRNRDIAASVLIGRGQGEFTEAELRPAIEEIERPPGTPRETQRDPDIFHVHHEEQLLALQLLARLSPGAVRERLPWLREHPSQKIRALAESLFGSLASIQGTAEARAELEGQLPVGRATIKSNPSGIELIRIPGGRFRMGSTPREEGALPNEQPAHEVEVSEFYLARHPVTNEQYARFLRDNRGVNEPEFWADRNYNQPRQPVVGVSWEEARAFCEWAGLELPSEAQWEYACRAGTTTRFWSGDGEEELARVGWYDGNTDGRLHHVAEKHANPFGLFDVHGNVWEWCLDAWSHDFSQSMKAHPDPYERQGSDARVVRGGSFNEPARNAHSARRAFGTLRYRYVGLGFRPAKGISPS